MKKITFLVAAVFVSFFACTSVFALPGVTQHIPDVSGEYVFYRDVTFDRETYVGFVYYNESTYGLRYYAPAVADKKAPLPEKDLQVYFTVDASQSHFEPTGERHVGVTGPEDTDVINYLHDVMYELTARRSKVGDVSEEKSVTEDYPQFGGEVTLTYSPLVPLFNLRGIQSLDGKTVLCLVTTGLLSAANGEQADTSFTDFKGFPKKTADKSHVFKRNKKAGQQTFTYSKDEKIQQVLTLDSQWTQYADNFFFLGKNALVTFDVAVQAGAAEKPDYAQRLLRRFLQSNPNSYADWTSLSFKQSGSRRQASLSVYDQKAGSVMQLFRVLDEMKDGSVAFLLLSVYDGVYEKHKSYFDTLLESYRLEATAR